MPPAEEQPQPIRLNRYLAQAGIAARRKADELIAAGRVTVNGEKPPPGGVLVTPGVDAVRVDGREVSPDAPRRTVMLNKPPGHLSAVSDRTRRPLVTHLLPPELARGLAPVGRLDLDSRGLLLLTDDGELSFRLQHPRYHVEKEYEVRLAAPLPQVALERLRAGIRLEEGRATPAALEPLDGGGQSYRVVLRQGWKRQIRRMFAHVRAQVTDLRRVRVGPLPLGDLPEGKWRELTTAEITALRQTVGLTEPPEANASAGLEAGGRRRRKIVSIDGPSASGKSTIGRMLARHLGLPLVDTGLMYRAVTVLALDHGVPLEDEPALARLARDSDIEVNTSAEDAPAWQVRAEGRDLGARVFSAAIAPALSRVSQVAGVRHELVEIQRRMGRGGVVMVGRDIGTVVFPHADLKLYVDASERERTRRRAAQIARGEREPTQALLEGEVADRDAADSGREHSPLRPAEDAHKIDTDGRSVAEVFEEILGLLKRSAGEEA